MIAQQTKQALKTLLTNCIALQRHEHLAVVTHESLANLGETLGRLARPFTRKITLVSYANLKKTDFSVPEGVRDLLRKADAGLVFTPGAAAPARFSRARQNGTRIVLMQNASAALIERAVDANFRMVSIKSRKIADLFSIGKLAKVTSKNGTDMELAIGRQKGSAETGLAHDGGELTSLPAGEATLILKENVSGKIVLDRIAGQRRNLAKPIILHVAKGRISQLKGQREAELLRKELRKFGSDARKIHEFGVGTNSNVVLGNSSQEDEKANGTIHISFGKDLVTNTQGKFLPAIKGMILSPSLTIDGKTILQDGEFML